jgi:hypothetical protein
MGFCEYENELSGYIKDKLKDRHVISLVGFRSMKLLSKISETREILNTNKQIKQINLAIILFSKIAILTCHP